MAPSFFETKRYGSVSAKMCHFIRNGINDDTILLKKHIVWYCRCFCLYGTLFAQRIATSYRKKRKPTRNGSCRLLMFSVCCGECGYDCLFYQTRTGRYVLRKTYKRKIYWFFLYDQQQSLTCQNGAAGYQRHDKQAACAQGGKNCRPQRQSAGPPNVGCLQNGRKCHSR